MTKGKRRGATDFVTHILLYLIYPHKRGKLKLFFYCFVNLSKHNIYALFGRFKQFLSCFGPHLMYHSVTFLKSPSMQEKDCLFFQCFVEKKRNVPEVEYGRTGQPDFDFYPRSHGSVALNGHIDANFVLFKININCYFDCEVDTGYFLSTVTTITEFKIQINNLEFMC